MNSLLQMMMIDDLYDSIIGEDENNNVGGGCLTVIVFCIGVFIFVKLIGFIEGSLSPYFYYFLAMIVVFTVAIPIIDLSDTFTDQTLSIGIRILNLICGYIVMWLLIKNVFGYPIGTQIMNQAYKTINSIDMNGLLKALLILLSLVVRFGALALDLFFIPMCTIPLLQNLIYKLIGVRSKMFIKDDK